jgi:hypothetical protein
MMIDYIYLNDLSLLEIQGLDKELIEVYKLSQKYGILSLMSEVRTRLNTKLHSITVDNSKERMHDM